MSRKDGGTEKCYGQFLLEYGNQYLLFYKQKIGTDLMCNKGTDLGADMLAISPTAAKTARAR